MDEEETQRTHMSSKQNKRKPRVCHYHTLTSTQRNRGWMCNAEEFFSITMWAVDPQVGKQEAPAHPWTLANGLLTALPASRESH